MKKALSCMFILALVLLPVSAAFAGGDETAEPDAALQDTQKALEDQVYKTRDLEDKVADLQKQLEDLKNQPPKVEERVVEKEADYTLPIHGFFNVNYADPNYEGYEGTYDQENFNIIFDSMLSENYRFYGELGYRHGAEIDVDLNSVEGVGEVYVWNAYLDYIYSKQANLRFGKFLTPYGKWNVELHSPARCLSVWDPILVRRDLFPKTMTGVQFYGDSTLGSVDLIYNLYTGNGDGWRPHSEDDNQNKGIGSRVAVLTSVMDMGTLEAGINGYIGRDGTLNDEDQNAWGFDALWNIFPFQVRGEFMKSRYMLPTNKWFSDAWFLQASYNFMEKYDVYVRYDSEDTDYMQENLGAMTIAGIGLNYKPIPKVAFKLEYDAYDQDILGTYEAVAASVACEF
jgi:hypothetical protein